MALLCLLWVNAVSRAVVGDSGTPLILASMGAAAVLMFAAPASSMASPWSLVVGNLVSACIGVTFQQAIPEPWLAGPLAVGSAIVAMHLLRCQHPPGGATALIAVVGGHEIHALSYHYVLAPVGLNLTAFLLMVILHRRLLAYLANRDAVNMHLRKIWARARSEARPLPGKSTRLGEHDALYELDDIQQALKTSATHLDISPKQLDELFMAATHHARVRRFRARFDFTALPGSEAYCAYGDSLLEAWWQMQAMASDCLVVIDSARQVQGQLTAKALLSLVGEHVPEGKLYEYFIKAISPSGEVHSDKAEVVGQLMQPIECLSIEQVHSGAFELPQGDFVALLDEHGCYQACLDLRD
jgi:CBS domain-containing membrane protein